MSLHNRPTCRYRTLSRCDDPTRRLEQGIDPRAFDGLAGDEVKIWIKFTCLSEVKACRFSYVTTDDAQVRKVALTNGEPVLLPGVRPIASVSSSRIASVNVRRWTITCKDQETSTKWRASGEVEDGKLFYDVMVQELELVMVE